MAETKLPRRLLDSAVARIVVAAAASAIVLTAVFSVLVFENQISLIAENALLRSVRAAFELRERVESVAASGAAWAQGMRAVEETAAALEIRKLTVFSREGDVLYTMDADRKPGSPVASIPELRAIHRAITRRDFENSLFTHSFDEGRRTIKLDVPFGRGTAPGGVVTVEFGVGTIDKAIGRLRRQALWLAGLVVLVNGVLAAAAHMLLVRPLYRILQATQAVAGGHYNLVLPRSGTYEIRALTDSFLRMSQAVADMQKDARASNPLTGLPGNVEIERRINEKLGAAAPFAVLYCDLDNFKAYNDCYGFAKGDDVIRYTRDCLSAACETASGDTFIGHQGGDDFVVVCRHEDWERVASGFLSLFDGGVGRFYNETDRARGYILARDRQDHEQHFPLLSVSVAAASNKNRHFASFGEVVDAVAEVKRLVKSRAGSDYAIDRREARV